MMRLFKKLVTAFLLAFLVLSPIGDAKTPWTNKPPMGVRIDWSYPITRGLLACWLMNENGGILRDLAGNSHAYKVGNPTWGVSAKGKYWVAPANDNYYTITNVSRFNALQDMTVEVLVFMVGDTTGENGNGWISKAAAWDNIHFYLRSSWVWTGTVSWQLQFQGTGWGVVSDAGSIPGYGFHHIVGTLGANGSKIYNNGKLLKTGTTATTYKTGSTFRFVRNAWWDGYSTSRILFCRIWNRELSAVEIQQLDRDYYFFIKTSQPWYVVAGEAITDVFSGRGIGRGIARGIGR